jgi:hypothetical protein
MTGNYDDLIRASKKYKEERDTRFKNSSNERLLKIARKKIQTTMIGALSTIENNFGFLWGSEESSEITEEQQHMKDIFDQVRSEILDRGNNQARNLEAEMSQYEVKWLKYSINIPVVTMETKEGEENA